MVKWIGSKPWLQHDVMLYAGSFVTLWLANTPSGAGWDTLIAAAPVASSQAFRMLLAKVGGQH